MPKREPDPFLCEIRDNPTGNRCGKKAVCTTSLMIVVSDPSPVGFIKPATLAHMCQEHLKKLQPAARKESKP